jgi:hypothetical protein
MANKKKHLLGILVMILVFGTTNIMNLEAQTDSRLDGTWDQLEYGVHYELKMRNGNFEELYDDIPWRRGIYTTSNRELTVVPTHIFGGGWNFLVSDSGINFGVESKWYSFNEFVMTIKSSLLRLGAPEREADEFVKSAISSNTTSSYSVDNNTLILISELLGERIVINLTKK